MTDQPSHQHEQSISLNDIRRALAPIKWALLLGAFLGAVLGWSASWLFQPVYRATTTMLPTKTPESSNGLGGIASQVGGLAALAGVNLQSNENIVAASEYLRSDTLARKFIDSHGLMVLLFPNRWDEAKHQGIPGRFGGVPTESSGLRRFKSSILRIAEDKRTGLVTVTVDWKDPAAACQWANDYVSIANEGMRARAISDAQATIDYLDDKLDKTPSLQVKESLSRIIESQLRTLALAKVREDYAFRVVDAAVLPDKGDIVSPRRSVMAIVGLIIGAGIFGWIKFRKIRAK